jgi:CRISPR system Cascade subunit CasA
MYDLLHDELIGVRSAQGEDRVNLPELFAALSDGRIEGYTGLRAHQADPWHVFLVQLAASIQARRPTDALPADPVYWREGLFDLAEGKETAWQLVVEDVTKPAFLQHPWKSWEAEAKNYGIKPAHGKPLIEPKASTPDELDVLVTAKNHDVKMARIYPEMAEAWLYALLLYQTTNGFLGQGNYGIIRMNGGFASRSIVAWVRDRHPSQRFAEEVQQLKGLRSSLLSARYSYRERGVVLTWLEHWDRSSHQYVLSDLEPWFIETARPVRLWSNSNGRLLALGATSKARQIGPKSLENGDVGDPWIPLNIQDKKKGQSALTLSKDGWTPKLLTDLLFEQGYKLTELQSPKSGDGTSWFVASCLVRGQGETEGFHRIELPVPPKARIALFDKQSRDTLGRLAQNLLKDARDAQNALGTALAVLTEGGPEKPDFDRDAVAKWLDGARRDFARFWEATYFPTLWRGAEENPETVRKDWQQQLVNQAHALLAEAAHRLPLPASRYWRATSQANGIFRGRLRKFDLPLPGMSFASEEVNEEETIA